jgi:branched-chain amino acid transport system substrate-binding protein
MPSTQRTRRIVRRPRAILGATLVFAMVLITAGCGSRLTNSTLESDARGVATGSSAHTSRNKTASSASAAAASTPSASASTTTTTGPPAAGTTSGTSGVVASSSAAGAPSSAATSSAAAAPAAGCTTQGNTLNLGEVGEESGPLGSIFAPITQGTAAWVAYENAHGGLDCHPLKLFVADDGGDPATNQALTEQLVEQDHVVAFLGNDAALAGQASVSYINTQKIPAIGSDSGASPWFYGNPYFFPSTTSNTDFFQAVFQAVGQATVPQGETKFASLVCIEAAICANFGPAAKTYAPKYGFNVVDQTTASITQTDYTPSCEAAQSAGAQVFFLGMDDNSIERVAHDCDTIGYKPTYGLFTLQAIPAIAQDPDLNGKIVVGDNLFPWMVTSNPVVATYQQALRDYEPSAVPSNPTFAGWVDGLLLAAAGTHLPANATSADLVNGLHALSGDTLGGVTSPLTFPPGGVTSLEICSWTVTVSGTNWTSNGKETCS